MTDSDEALLLPPFVADSDGSLPEQLYHYLRSAIRSGELAPGQRLVEQAIATATSTSRTPVREALRKLVGNGLAESSGRGLVVARLSSQELQELWEANEALWLTVGKLAVERATVVDIAEMTYLIHSAQSADATQADQIRLNDRLLVSGACVKLSDWMSWVVRGRVEGVWSCVRGRPGLLRYSTRVGSGPAT